MAALYLLAATVNVWVLVLILTAAFGFQLIAGEPPCPLCIVQRIALMLCALGPLYVLYMAGLLSANLALVNALPFPPLDGGRMLVILLKAIPRYGTRISLRAERVTYAVGFVALFTFLIWITVFDIGRSVFPQAR